MVIVIKKIVYYYNGKKIVATKESKLKMASEVDSEKIRYFLDEAEVSKDIYKYVEGTIKDW